MYRIRASTPTRMRLIHCPIRRWVIWSSCLTRGNRAVSVELPWPLGGRNRGSAAILGGPKLRISTRLLYLVRLGAYWRHMPFACKCLLLRRWASDDTSIAAVITHAIYRGIVVDDRRVVDVSDIRNIHICHGAVIEKVVTLPPSAHEAVPEITESIVDTAIESNVRPPIAVIKHERAAHPSPIRRSPKEPRLGRHHPRTWHPVVVIAIVVPCPVSWSPYVTFSGAKGLLVNGQCRRAETD